MDYKILRNKLKQALGRSWAKILAEELNCSDSLICKVCSGEKPDRQGIITLALQKIKQWNEEQESQSMEFKKILGK